MTSQIVDLSSISSTKFTWRIENFSKLNAHEGHRSNVFSVGSFKWCVRIYPKGKGVIYDHLTLGLVPIELTESVQAKFNLSVTSQTDPRKTRRLELNHNFNHNFTNNDGWGWPRFMRLDELHDTNKGYLVNDTCVIRVEVTCKMLEKDSNGEGGNTDPVPEPKRSKIKEERQ